MSIMNQLQNFSYQFSQRLKPLHHLDGIPDKDRFH